LPVLAANLDFGDFVPRFLRAVFALEDLRVLFALWRERAGFSPRRRKARSAVEDKGDLRP
jgi:hypothetical protein